MLPSLTFKDFTAYDKFLKIQNDFALNHIHSNPTDIPYKEVVKSDFKIFSENYESLNNEPFLEEVSFYNDYLLPEIDKLPTRFINYFKKRIEDHLIIKPEDVKDAARFYLRSFQEQLQLIKSAEYLESHIIDNLQERVYVILDYLMVAHINPRYSLNDKIRFKLKRNEIILFFYLLKKKKYLDHRYDYELGPLIDRYFMYWNTLDKEYKEINNSRVTLSDFGSTAKTYKKALNNIQKIFDDLLVD